MTKILFVDDEPKILDGLKRMLRSMRHEWDMEFASGGQAALEMLGRAPFEVIVTDMRMPGMDGVQLLKEVMKRFPLLIRIILSGQTDQEAFLSSSCVVHQFLSKPCDTQMLKTTIERACALQNLLQRESLKKLVLQIESLPSQSSLYAEIKAALQSPNISMGKIGQIIARDVGMTAKTIQLANSSFYGSRRRISSPTDAAVILGINTIRALVLSHNIFSDFTHTTSSWLSPEELWKHSSATGLFAREIAKMESYTPEMTEDALIAGLLHDLGKLVLATNLSAQYNEAQQLSHGRNIPLWEAEQTVFGGTHAEVGAYLIGLWGIARSIVEALAFHHNPGSCAAKTSTLVLAVHVADVFANEVHPVKTGMEVKVDNNYLTNAGMAERLPAWRESCMALYRQ